MKKLILLSAAFLLASSARAQSTSSTWRDVTAAPYSVKNDCSTSASSGINSAISGAPAGSGVIFFPAGCYLITTQIVDTNTSAYLTYLGEGTVELRASGTPSGSVIQFGNDTTTVSYRQVENLYFNCSSLTGIDGIDLDGLTHSAFDERYNRQLRRHRQGCNAHDGNQSQQLLQCLQRRNHLWDDQL